MKQTNKLKWEGRSFAAAVNLTVLKSLTDIKRILIPAG